MSKKVLITGAAGFIGFHSSKRLIDEGYEVIGIDNFNNYYDVKLKKARIEYIEKSKKSIHKKWKFIKCDLLERTKLDEIFDKYNPEYVINLAAQAGVRYSIDNPREYINSNIVGFMNLIECCRHNEVKHFIYASSSSVYGGNKTIPFKEDQGVNHPVSLYAATKRSNELIAHTYSHLYNLPSTGLRFFTVYGPWGRPDMAYYIFTSKILKGEPIKIFNHGKMLRDFTYIDDVTNVISKIIHKIPKSNIKFDLSNPVPSKSWAPFKIFNVGNSNPMELITFIKIIENKLGLKAKKELLSMQLGDVEATSSDLGLIDEWVGFKPETSIEKGIEIFINWYKNYYNI
tara:strand:+ start:1617 stop:2645 length:1029 start_codon:yes stop_codon:yes gene_type:complete